MCRPLLLIDIDGVISLSGFDARQPPPGQFELVEGIVHFLSATAGELLGTLSGQFELVWCSGWEEKADEHLPRALGLPAGLAHLSFPRPAPGRAARGGEPRHWKLATIEDYAGPVHPLAWIDDDFDETCHLWAGGRQGETKLVATEPAVGFTAEQAEDLRAWAKSLKTARR